MINSTNRITQTNYILSIKNTLFHNIESSEAGGVICAYNVDIQIKNCFFIQCYSPKAAAIYIKSSILSIKYGCFSELSVRYTGNDGEGIVIDSSDTLMTAEYCSTYKCAESASMGADSTFWVRTGRFSFSYGNLSDCNGKDGAVTFANREMAYGSTLKYCSISHCSNYDLVEFYINLVKCNFANCQVTCFGYAWINFTQCYFMNVNQKSDHGNVYYFDCIGEYPNYIIDGESINLPLIHNRICFRLAVNDCSNSKSLQPKSCVVSIFFMCIKKYSHS